MILKQVTLIFIHSKKAISISLESAAPSDLVTINLQHLTQALEKKTRHETSSITHIKKKNI